ncbi:hypothetical protein JVT61DRAFT_12224 [Boletus reticuloceps]|uniref:RING-type domain-containing protein n=1 Tax=Boletus reticuloceps TaxID=495285 RepID=A0A8I2YE78_9AGAM|nr:hypothetical protein JVT61DRAFT_12224 [Boletus reticuloceps]
MEVRMWREHSDNLEERMFRAEAARDEALGREERAQWMRIAAEKRPRDSEAENVVLMKQKDAAQTGEGLRLTQENFRLVGRVEEMIRMLKDLYECVVCFSVMEVPLTTRCGHTVCAECGIRTWLQEALKAPRHRDGLGLSKTRCPMCRQPYPRIATMVIRGHRGHSTVERCPSSLPFIHNVNVDAAISDIHQNLQTVVQKLQEEMPEDDQVKEWAGKYANMDAIEIRGHFERTERRQGMWKTFKVTFSKETGRTIFENAGLLDSQWRQAMENREFRESFQ